MRREPPYLGDEADSGAAGGGCCGGDGGRVLALGVEEASDRLVGGADEGVLEVELVLVGVLILLLLQLPQDLLRHVHGGTGRTRRGTGSGGIYAAGEGTIAAAQC